MKVTSVAEKESFKPVVVEVSFETPDEYRVFITMLRFNVTVPNNVLEETADKAILIGCMNAMRDGMEKANQN